MAFKTYFGCFFDLYFKTYSTLCFGYCYKNMTTLLTLPEKANKKLKRNWKNHSLVEDRRTKP